MDDFVGFVFVAQDLIGALAGFFSDVGVAIKNLFPGGIVSDFVSDQNVLHGAVGIWLIKRLNIWGERSGRWWTERTSWSLVSWRSTCSSFGSSAMCRRMRLVSVLGSGTTTMASRLKARRAKRPVMCDIVPGWLRTMSSRMVEVGIGLGMGELWLGDHHVAVGGARGNHWVHIFCGVDRDIDHAGAVAGEGGGDLCEWVGGWVDANATYAETASDGGEVRTGGEARGFVALAVEELLLLAHEAEVGVVEDQHGYRQIFFGEGGEFLDVHQDRTVASDAGHATVGRG